MAEPLVCVPPTSIITGWDFSTGAVKCLAFDLEGRTLAEIRLPTDLWDRDGVSELNLMQLEGQARATTRAIAGQLREQNRLRHWVAGGISATHHTSGRIDGHGVQVRRAICWNDHTLGQYHEIGLRRLGGQEAVRRLIGGPWAIRYSLSHLVKDERTLPAADWRRTRLIVSHGGLAAGFLTGNFGVISVSAAASTGLLDLRSAAWCKEMLGALENPEYRQLAWQQLPRILAQDVPVGPLSASLALEAGVPEADRPLIFPTSDDQQAGLVGGGAVDAGQMAIVLGNSAVVNSSSAQIPATDALDCMRLNWGPYLWMRCYNNGAQFLDTVVGGNPDWAALEAAAEAVPPGCEGVSVLPFVHPEPSLQVLGSRVVWTGGMPESPGKKFRAALEALAYLIALGVQAHEKAGQQVTRVTVSGGIARSPLMCQILATVLDRPLHLLVSSEGPALGAAVTALAALESHLRRVRGIEMPYTVADAVAVLVKFRGEVRPNPAWRQAYARGLQDFASRLTVTS